MKFSIIIPARNASATIERCVQSAINQTYSAEDYEIIYIDDGGTPNGPLYGGRPKVRAYPGPRTGPGSARNVGLRAATGEYIVFLDADDELVADALEVLAAGMQTDVILYGRTIVTGPTAAHVVMPDLPNLEDYLRLRQDGSVLMTCVRRQFLLDNHIFFEEGLHEDVDFLFEVFLHKPVSRMVYLPLYRKHDTYGSVVNTVTEAHLEGFVRAWRRVGSLLSEDWQQNAWYEGTVSMIATRARAIATLEQDPARRRKLYLKLHKLVTEPPMILRNTSPSTQYQLITDTFLKTLGDFSENEQWLTERIRRVAASSWSCTDLQGSVFLGPDQVRTCCKRFFVDGEQRGDVVLLDKVVTVTPAAILEAKQRLKTSINMGDPSPCGGCPFLEFKQWSPLKELKVTRLSMEYHSSCNLRCSYCSDTYYGGKKPSYNVFGLLTKLELADNCTIVWGGGEPTIGQNFDEMLASIAANHPKAQQRILTNATFAAPAVVRELEHGNIAVTVSVDAGTPETFERVRGKDKLQAVMSTLDVYASIRPENLTVKYILTEDNCGTADLLGFAILAERWKAANFQISCDFKQETMTDSQLTSVKTLHDAVRLAGCKVVFFDDLMVQRLPVTDLSDLPPVRLYGCGWQGKRLIGDFNRAIAGSYDDNKDGDRISKFDEKARDIAICASQSYPVMYRKLRGRGFESQILTACEVWGV